MTDRNRKGTARPSQQSQRASAQRAAEARARIAAAERRRRTVVVSASVGAVIVVLGLLVAARAAMGGNAPKSGQKAAAAASSVASRVTGVPASVLDRVGSGTAAVTFTPVSGAALTSGGKPEVLYVGAEWCPYCAATRWSLAVALSRFGTLSGLGQTASSPSDVYPNTPTLTFHGATYSSRYLTFVGKEVQSNQASGNAYAALDRLSSTESKLFQAAGGGFPFVDVGGRYRLQEAPFSPQLLAGKTHAQVAAALSDPSSPIAKGVDGGANAITAAICRITDEQPAAVCRSAAVAATARSLRSS